MHTIEQIYFLNIFFMTLKIITKFSFKCAFIQIKSPNQKYIKEILLMKFQYQSYK